MRYYNSALEIAGIELIKGDPGDKGNPGDTGAPGPKGDTGDTGQQGPQGVAGDKGDKGDTGQQGPQGVTGDKGDTGDVFVPYQFVRTSAEFVPYKYGMFARAPDWKIRRWDQATKVVMIAIGDADPETAWENRATQVYI